MDLHYGFSVSLVVYAAIAKANIEVSNKELFAVLELKEFFKQK